MQLKPPVHPESTPPETPLAKREFPRGPESLLPPRNMPSAGLGLSLTSAAAVAAFQVQDPDKRAALIIVCAFVAWLVGYFTPPPRRKFRRNDDRR